MSFCTKQCCLLSMLKVTSFEQLPQVHSFQIFFLNVLVLGERIVQPVRPNPVFAREWSDSRSAHNIKFEEQREEQSHSWLTVFIHRFFLGIKFRIVARILILPSFLCLCRLSIDMKISINIACKLLWAFIAPGVAILATSLCLEHNACIHTRRSTR